MNKQLRERDLLVCCSVSKLCPTQFMQPYELPHARLPCPSLSPGVHSNSCPLSQWCHPTASSSATPSPLALNLSHHQGLFQWVGSSHQVAKVWSFSFSISPSNEFQDWFPLGLTGLISLLSKWLSRVFSSTTVWKHHFFGAQPSLWSSSCIHTWLEKP